MSDPIESTWRGVTRYACPHCPYDTTNPDRIEQHLRVQHRYRPGPLVEAHMGEVLDPLCELTNEEYEALTPPEKGARTRKANEQQREDEALDDDASDDDTPPDEEG